MLQQGGCYRGRGDGLVGLAQVTDEFVHERGNQVRYESTQSGELERFVARWLEIWRATSLKDGTRGVTVAWKR